MDAAAVYLALPEPDRAQHLWRYTPWHRIHPTGPNKDGDYDFTHLERLVEAVQEVGGGRVREIAALVGRQHCTPVPIRPRQFRFLVSVQSLPAHRSKAQPRRQHEPFLRPRNRHVDTPLVMEQVHGTQ